MGFDLIFFFFILFAIFYSLYRIINKLSIKITSFIHSSNSYIYIYIYIYVCVCDRARALALKKLGLSYN